jgi:hypothetical protein
MVCWVFTGAVWWWRGRRGWLMGWGRGYGGRGEGGEPSSATRPNYYFQTYLNNNNKNK